MPRMRFSAAGIGEALKKVGGMKPTDAKAGQFLDALCQEGVDALKKAYTTSGTGESRDSVTYSHLGGGVYEITAQSGHLFYLEFGAGVTYNDPDPYPVPRPPGIGGIGTQGKGRGKQPFWSYPEGPPDADGKQAWAWTKGTRARAGFPAADRAMRDALERLAKKYLGKG